MEIIKKIFHTETNSSAIVIPSHLVKKLDLQYPNYVFLEEKDNGIFIRKLHGESK